MIKLLYVFALIVLITGCSGKQIQYSNGLSNIKNSSDNQLIDEYVSHYFTSKTLFASNQNKQELFEILNEFK